MGLRNINNYVHFGSMSGPIQGTVTTEQDMNGFWDFQQILVNSTARILYFIDSLSFKRMRIE